MPAPKLALPAPAAAAAPCAAAAARAAAPPPSRWPLAPRAALPMPGPSAGGAAAGWTARPGRPAGRHPAASRLSGWQGSRGFRGLETAAIMSQTTRRCVRLQPHPTPLSRAKPCTLSRALTRVQHIHIQGEGPGLLAGVGAQRAWRQHAPPSPPHQQCCELRSQDLIGRWWVGGARLRQIQLNASFNSPRCISPASRRASLAHLRGFRGPPRPRVCRAERRQLHLPGAGERGEGRVRLRARQAGEHGASGERAARAPA